MPVLLSADEFLTTGWPTDARRELVRGEVQALPLHGGAADMVADNVRAALSAFVRARNLGRCFGSTGFLLPLPPEPADLSRGSESRDTVRAPDVAFVRRHRVPAHGFGAGWLPFAPDLAVVVPSPAETTSRTGEKVADYLAAGTGAVWIVDPAKRLVALYAADAPTRWLREGEVLDGGVVVRGFALPMDALFEDVASV